MSSGDNSEVPVDHQKTKKLVKSQYYDVMVKVDADVYCLDRLQLAWKSDFFEKLFNEQSDQKECSLIELSVMDTNTFSAIVDIIYGRPLTSVLNHNNCVALLMAMNHLQMEIDVETYASFIEKNSVVDVELFKLLNFLQKNANLQYLLPAVFISLSVRLVKIQHNKDFLRLPLDDIFRIIISGGCAIDMRTMCQICSQWIHHDLRSRLAHFAKLVNAVKRRLGYVTDIKDEDFKTVLTDGIADEEINPEMTKKLFYKRLICNGEIDSSTWGVIYAPQKSLKDEKKQVSNEEKNKQVLESLKNNDAYDIVVPFITVQKQVPIYSTENERRKLKTLVENHRFHDIVVTTGEKAYKLHRFVLNSASGYFAEIFSAKQSNVDAQFAQASTLQQIKTNEYSLVGVDQATCDMIFEYIYFDELRLSSETIIPVFKAANTLKMKKLLAKCVAWMKMNIEEICAKVLIADKSICRSWIIRNIAEIFSKLISEPATADTLPLCFISFDMLEDLLLSSFHCCSDPHRILDTCSKWVFYDVKNRYHLIPKIALAINRNCITKYQEYKIELPEDSNNCSEESIRIELLKTLNATSLIPSAENMLQNNEKKSEEMPVFISWTRETSTIYVLNANLEQIATLRLSFDSQKPSYGDSITATLIDDNLFIMLSLRTDDLGAVSLFNVYNLSSKKFISLNSSVSLKGGWYSECTLLNCRGQVYCCFEKGHVLKYSIELNRWMIFLKSPGEGRSDENRICIGRVGPFRFTSDGDKLYRLSLYSKACSEESSSNSECKYVMELFTLSLNSKASAEGLSSNSECEYVVDEFNFQQNAWLPLPHLSFLRSGMISVDKPPKTDGIIFIRNSTSPSDKVENLTITNGSMLTVILPSSFMSFDQNSEQWQAFSMADNTPTQIHLKSFAVVQFENELLHVCLNKLYQWSERNQTWDLKKELPLRLGSESSDERNQTWDLTKELPLLRLGSELSDGSKNRGPYDCISAIHRRSVRTD
ncbi:uncharacterized protein LOC135842909 [Planococcus citri]|uniref:uncharacterized protein LOC135842909 n=1 Tax=Planococcus citri TaxID=170843 RepID=UPI0031F90F63